MRTTARALAAVAAAVLLAACGADDDVATVDPGSTSSPSSSPAGPSPSDPAAQTELLVVASESGLAPATEQRTYQLTCDPAGGDHPDPEAACAVLAEVGPGAFDAPPRDQVCTEQYGGPQTASVTGVVAGQPVQATFDRTNGCGISRWDALAPVLALDVGGAGS